MEFVEQDKIKNLVKKYSEFINYPIKLYLSHDEKVQVPEDTPVDNGVTVTKFDTEGNEVTDTEDAVIEEEEEKTEGDDMEITDEGEEDASDEPKMKTITEQKWDW